MNRIKMTATPQTGYEKDFTHKGITIIEILITVALVGVIAAISINILSKAPNEHYNRLISDYKEHLAGLLSTIELKSGKPIDINAGVGLGACLDPNNTDCPENLHITETGAVFTAGPPAYIDYPSKLRVYLYPQEILGYDPDPDGLNNKYLLIDVNGDDGPNSLGSDGDWVVLNVDGTNRIRTLYDVTQDDTYCAFYDGDACNGSGLSAAAAITTGHWAGHGIMGSSHGLLIGP